MAPVTAQKLNRRVNGSELITDSGVSSSTTASENGINASINVHANITPNITIRVEMPEGNRQRPQPSNGNQTQFNGTPPLDTPGLPRDVMQQITTSVNRYRKENFSF